MAGKFEAALTSGLLLKFDFYYFHIKTLIIIEMIQTIEN